jgi:hypothetical protein
MLYWYVELRPRSLDEEDDSAKLSYAMRRLREMTWKIRYPDDLTKY